MGGWPQEIEQCIDHDGPLVILISELAGAPFRTIDALIAKSLYDLGNLGSSDLFLQILQLLPLEALPNSPEKWFALHDLSMQGLIINEGEFLQRARHQGLVSLID